MPAPVLTTRRTTRSRRRERPWRLIAALPVVAVAVFVTAAPAGAHAFRVKVELPLPLGFFFAGAAVALAISFLALAVLWRTSRLEQRVEGRPLPGLVQAAAPVLTAAGRVLGLALFLGVFLSALMGRDSPALNVAPRAVYVVFWVGLTVVSALVGDVWRVISPFETLAVIGQWLRRATGGGAAPRPYPQSWGHWPAAGLLFGFVWLELVFPDNAEPSTLALAIEVYTLAVLAGTATWGRSWLRQGEAFAVFFGLLSHMAPLYQGDDGRLRLRPPLAGLAELRPKPGLAAVVLVALGSTSFDGLSRSRFWRDIIAGQDEWNSILIGTLGLCWMVAMAGILYVGSMRVAGRITGTEPEDLIPAFVHSLIPIAFAYALAHYFSAIVFEGHTALALASDPLGRGWDLFGTATWVQNLELVSRLTIAWVQVGAIVAGHVGGVLVAHDRAVARFEPATATRSQYPLLVAMIVYTVGGLALLLGG